MAAIVERLLRKGVEDRLPGDERFVDVQFADFLRPIPSARWSASTPFPATNSRLRRNTVWNLDRAEQTGQAR